MERDCCEVICVPGRPSKVLRKRRIEQNRFTSLTDSLISDDKCAEDPGTKITSLVRARD